MDAVAKALDSFLDQKVEARAILITKENGLAAIAAQDDVIERPWIVNSWLTSHGAILHNKLQLCKPDNHIKGTSEHTKRMDLMICLGKKSNPTQEVPYEAIIRGFRSAWQQQFVRNH